MALTPVDILHTQFRTSMKGYNRSQVDEFVRSVTQTLDEALREKNELQRRIEALESEVGRVKQIESAMTEALTIAQKSADDVRSNAHRQAQMIVQEAEQARVRMMVEAQQEAEKYRAEIAILQSTRDRFESEFGAMLDGYREWLGRRKSGEEVRTEVA